MGECEGWRLLSFSVGPALNWSLVQGRPRQKSFCLKLSHVHNNTESLQYHKIDDNVTSLSFILFDQWDRPKLAN